MTAGLDAAGLDGVSSMWSRQRRDDQVVASPSRARTRAPAHAAVGHEGRGPGLVAEQLPFDDASTEAKSVRNKSRAPRAGDDTEPRLEVLDHVGVEQQRRLACPG